MKLLGTTNGKTTKNENSENMPYFEIPEVVLVHCNIVNNYCLKNSRVLYTFVANKSFGSVIRYFTLKCHIFKNISFRIFIYWSMVYGSKFEATRDRR